MNILALIFALIVLLSSLAFGQTAQPTPYVRPDAEKRFKRYLNDTVGPFSWVGTAASAGIATASNEPEEWGKTGE